jgi:hypothetical protein
MKQVRQGDVYLVPAKIPASAKPEKPLVDGYALAFGEATGHAHMLKACEAVEVLTAEDGKRFVRLAEEIVMNHVHRPTGTLTTDHKPVKVAPGEYEVRIQKETQPDGVVRPVID